MLGISIVIPAFNEAQRLPETLRALKVFAVAKNPYWNIEHILVVDDGSQDLTAECVRGFQNDWAQLHLLSLEKNQGKGAAIHAGLHVVKSEWVLIADADMATPWEELSKLVALSSGYDLLMGSRGLQGSDILVRQHWLRQNMGKVFNRILRAFVGLSFQDTQCGFKLLRNDLFFQKEIAPQLRVRRFAWDVELILQLLRRNKKIMEVPIRWQHREKSSVHILFDSCEMLWTVWNLKRRICLEAKNRDASHQFH